MKPISCIKWMLTLCLLSQPWLARAEWEKVDENHLAFASKSEAMGEGKTLFTSTQSTSWKPVSGDTVGEKVIEMLCGHHAKPPGHGKGKDDKAAPAKDAHGDGHGAPPAAHGDAKPSH